MTATQPKGPGPKKKAPEPTIVLGLSPAYATRLKAVCQAIVDVNGLDTDLALTLIIEIDDQMNLKTKGQTNGR